MNRHLFLPTLLVIAALLAPLAPCCAADEPPEIIVAPRSPALLVAIDGPPEYVLVRNTTPLLWRVTNTKTLLLKDAEGRHYLRCYDGYLEAATLNEPWRVAKKAPSGAFVAEQTVRGFRKFDLLEGKPDPKTKKKPSLKKVMPWIYLTMVPAELMAVDGQPDFISIEGTGLFYARNTSGDLFWNQDDGALYLAAAGQMYRADEFMGPWSPLPVQDIPADFLAIPDTNPKKNVKAFVAAASAQGRGDVPETGWLRSYLTRRRLSQYAAITSPPQAVPQKQWCPFDLPPAPPSIKITGGR